MDEKETVFTWFLLYNKNRIYVYFLSMHFVYYYVLRCESCINTRINEKKSAIKCKIRCFTNVTVSDS